MSYTNDVELRDRAVGRSGPKCWNYIYDRKGLHDKGDRASDGTAPQTTPTVMASPTRRRYWHHTGVDSQDTETALDRKIDKAGIPWTAKPVYVNR